MTQKKWLVEMTKQAEGELRSDFKTGKITVVDIKVIKRWIADVEEQGLDFANTRQIGVITNWQEMERASCYFFLV